MNERGQKPIVNVDFEEEKKYLQEKLDLSEHMLANSRNEIARLSDEIEKAKTPEKRSTKVIGIISTLFIFAGSPTVSLFVHSILGWIFYSISAILGMIYTARRRDKPIFTQFIYYPFWNIIAIISRLY